MVSEQGLPDFQKLRVLVYRNQQCVGSIVLSTKRLLLGWDGTVGLGLVPKVVGTTHIFDA